MQRVASGTTERPDPARIDSSSEWRLGDDHVERLEHDGFVIVERFLTEDELAAASAAARELVPSVEEYTASDPTRSAWPGTEMRHFPYPSDVLNDMTTHPELLRFARRWIGTSNLAFGRVVLWAKYGVGIDFDQQLHLDYMGNSLVVPREEPGFRSLIAVFYYTDVTLDLGPTCVLGHGEATPFVGASDHITRDMHPDAYDHEVPVTVPAGSLLLYTLSSWHRGSAMSRDGGMRISHHMVVRAADNPWTAVDSWGGKGNNPDMRRFLQRAAPEQRAIIGFPPVGSPYWTPATVEAVSQRYPEMDMTPYRTNAG